LVIIAALVIALGGSLGVLNYTRGADQRALAGQQPVMAYVAKDVVPPGTTAAAAVDDGLIVQEAIARKAVPDGVLTQVDDTSGQLVATSAIQPGELVLRTRFAAKAATPGSLAVPEGKLAVSVALDDPSHVGPFVTVGSTVAVFDTFNVAETDKNDQTPAGDKLQDRHEYTRATRLLLPAVEVLAVGDTTSTTTDEKDKQQAASAAGGQNIQLLVTLAVSQPQAEKLVHASRTGTLTAALLGPKTTATPGKGTDDRRLFTDVK
jgi:pilus assembly protein CpaB